jgi:hypothetical protein
LPGNVQGNKKTGYRAGISKKPAIFSSGHGIDALHPDTCDEWKDDECINIREAGKR